MPKVLSSLLPCLRNRFPIGWAGVVAKEREASVHHERVVGDCAMHCDELRIVLDVVIASVTIGVVKGNGTIPLPYTELVEGVGKV